MYFEKKTITCDRRYVKLNGKGTDGVRILAIDILR